MTKLKLEHRDNVLSCLKKLAKKKDKEFVPFMEEVYVMLRKTNNDDKLYDILFELKKSIKTESIETTKEELFHVLSFEINKVYSESVFKSSDKESIEEVFHFLDTNYLEIFKPYYEKKGFISMDDYEDCVLSLVKSFNLNNDICDVLVGNWLENKVITDKFL